MKTNQSLSEFLHLNERNLFWLFVAACLVFLANWFLATHGYFQLESNQLRILLLALSMCSPIIGILVLLSRDCRENTYAPAIFVFISILFIWPVATITSFIVLLCCWTKSSRYVGIAMLGVLQIFSAYLIVLEKKNPLSIVEITQLHTPQHELVLRGASSDGNFCDSLAVQEDFKVLKGIRLVKTFARYKGKEFDYRKELFSLSALDGNRAALVMQHGPRSHYTVIDLSTKNRLSQPVEDIY